MNLVSRAVWSLVGSLVYLGTVIDAAGVLEIDVVFPRTDEIYAPTDYFPIVFALQNSELAKNLKPIIYSSVRNGTRLETGFGTNIHDLTNTNYSSDPYFVYHYLHINVEGPYELFSTASWSSCNESSDEVTIIGNTTNFSVHFSIKEDGQEVNLVTATEKCNTQDGIAINITDQTHEVPPTLLGTEPSGTCAVLAYPSPILTANPCKVKIDTAAAASMSAFLHDSLCRRGLNPPDDCPEEDASQKLAVACIMSFGAALGAIAFLLA